MTDVIIDEFIIIIKQNNNKYVHFALLNEILNNEEYILYLKSNEKKIKEIKNEIFNDNCLDNLEKYNYISKFVLLKKVDKYTNDDIIKYINLFHKINANNDLFYEMLLDFDLINCNNEAKKYIIDLLNLERFNNDIRFKNILNIYS